MRRTLFVFSLIITLSCRKGGKSTEQFRTEKVDRGDVTMTVTATGTLSAVTTVQIGSQVSGVIARLYADFNSKVHNGQLLAELDPTSFQAQVEQRQADVTKARIDAANQRISYDRQRRLVAAGLAAQADLDSARAAYEGAEAQVKQSTAALQQSLTNLKYTKIVSPIDGVVVDRQYDVGQTVAASFQAPTLFSIAQDMTKMQVQADVDQSDIGRVQVGQTARFTVDAYPDQEFRGRIAQIRLNALVTQNVVTYPVIIEVPNPDEKLRPKMTANVTIDVATVKDVLRVANAALRFKPDTADVAGGATGPAGATGEGRRGGGAGTEGAAAAFGRGRGAGGAAGMLGGGARRETKSQTVYILGPDKKLTPVHIRTGISDGRFTAVVGGGLKAGDSVVVGMITSKAEGAPPPGSNAGPMGGGQRGPAGGGGGRRP